MEGVLILGALVAFAVITGAGQTQAKVEGEKRAGTPAGEGLSCLGYMLLGLAGVVVLVILMGITGNSLADLSTP